MTIIAFVVIQSKINAENDAIYALFLIRIAYDGIGMFKMKFEQKSCSITNTYKNLYAEYWLKFF